MRLQVVFADGLTEFRDVPEADPKEKLLLLKRHVLSWSETPCVRVGWLADGTPRFAEDSSLVPAGWGYGTDAYAGGYVL